MKLSVKSRLGESFSLDAVPGDTVEQTLARHGIPVSTTLCFTGDKMVPAETTCVGSDVRVEIVRPIDYLSFIKPEVVSEQRGAEPVYRKRLLSFDFEEDRVKLKQVDLDPEALIAYVEDTVVDAIRIHDMIEPGKVTGLAYSGGRDSVALLWALSRRKKDLRDAGFKVYTLEQWEQNQPNTGTYMNQLPRELGFEHRMVSFKEIESLFGFTKPFQEIYREISQDRSLTATERTMLLAQIQRRAVESAAERDGITNLMFGLNLEDLLSEIILTYTTGHAFSALPVRAAHKFRYSYPLAYLSKAELTAYLYVLAPQYAAQEPPSKVESGARTAGFYMHVIGHLMQTWPGVEIDFYQAYSKLAARMAHALVWTECSNCGSAMLDDKAGQPLCDPCLLYRERRLLKA